MGWPSYATAVAADTPGVGWWPLDDSLGLPQDRSGNLNHLTGATGTLTYRQAGPFTGALGITGTSASGQALTHAPFATPVDNLSIEFWVSLASGPSGFSFFCGNPGTNGWNLTTSGAQLLLQVNATNQAASVKGLDASGVWHYWVIVRDNGTWRYYFNGNIDTLNAGSTTPTTPSGNNFNIMSGGNITSTWSNIAYYNTVLTPSRIRAHYDAALTTDISNLTTHHGGKGATW